MEKNKTQEGGCLTVAAMWVSLVAFAIACALFFSGCGYSLKKENERLREELARAQQYVPMKRDTIRDTIEVVTQKVVTVEKVKNVLTKEDRQLLKDIGVKVKDLEQMQKMGMSTSDTVSLSPTPAPSPEGKGDSVLRYHDAWAEFEYWEREKRLHYAVRDSFAIAVKKEYKKRFLWWKWGTKGYEVKIVNFNPHTTIRYNTFVRRGE